MTNIEFYRLVFSCIMLCGIPVAIVACAVFCHAMWMQGKIMEEWMNMKPPPMPKFPDQP